MSRVLVDFPGCDAGFAVVALGSNGVSGRELASSCRAVARWLGSAWVLGAGGGGRFRAGGPEGSIGYYPGNFGALNLAGMVRVLDRAVSLKNLARLKGASARQGINLGGDAAPPYRKKWRVKRALAVLGGSGRKNAKNGGAAALALKSPASGGCSAVPKIAKKSPLKKGGGR